MRPARHPAISPPCASSVLAQGYHYAARARLGHGGPGESWEGFAPLAALLPDIDGTRFALAGLSSAAGESRAGEPQRLVAGRDFFRLGLTPSRDGEAVTRLRLTPPLAARPDTLELEVTGPSARLRAVVPVRAGQGKAQKGGH